MNQARRVLIVEDNPGDARLIMEMLAESGSGVAAESVDTLASAIERLAAADIDVALLDLGLPDSQGLETFARLRDAAPGVALVVLTGNSDVELAVRAVQEGAQDFLVKGKVDGELLTRAIAYAVGRQQADDAMTQERELLARAEEIARLGSWRYDLATKGMWWSDEMRLIFGLDPDNPPEDLVAAMEAVVHPEDRERALTVIRAVITDGEATSTQFRILLPGGTVRWFDVRSQQNRDARGAAVAVTGVAQDITELKLATRNRAIASLSAAMVVANASIQDLSDLVLADAKELTRSPLGFISLGEPTANGMGGCASADSGPSDVDRFQVPEPGANASYIHAWGWSSNSGEAFFTNSPSTHEALAETPEGHVPITSFLSAPAIAQGRFVGQIAVANAAGGYTDEDLDAVSRLAALYAIALVGQEERAALVASESSLRQSNLRFERMVYAVSEAMGRIVEARDPYTQGHEVRVAKLAKLIAEEMHLPRDDVNAIDMSGLVHDIGKLSIPAEILTKPGRLSDAEFTLIKGHPEAGHTILKGIDFPWPVADIVLAHHERRDGSGYPQGLKGEDIPLAARVLAVADVVEAMASHRPYRPALGLDAALAELVEHVDKYDSDVVQAFLAVHESGGTDFLHAV